MKELIIFELACMVLLSFYGVFLFREYRKEQKEDNQ
jgi:hypothetical protein